MGIWNWFSATPDIAAEDGLTEAENSLLAEAEFCADTSLTGGFQEPLHFEADYATGEVEVYESESDIDGWTMTISHGDDVGAANSTLLGFLNGSWGK